MTRWPACCSDEWGLTNNYATRGQLAWYRGTSGRCASFFCCCRRRRHCYFPCYYYCCNDDLNITAIPIRRFCAGIPAIIRAACQWMDTRWWRTDVDRRLPTMIRYCAERRRVTASRRHDGDGRRRRRIRRTGVLSPTPVGPCVCVRASVWTRRAMYL